MTAQSPAALRREITSKKIIDSSRRRKAEELAPFGWRQRAARGGGCRQSRRDYEKQQRGSERESHELQRFISNKTLESFANECNVEEVVHFVDGLEHEQDRFLGELEKV